MNTYTYKNKRKRYTQAYMRFKKQLIALHTDNISAVRQLASEARDEIKSKLKSSQIQLDISKLN